VFFPCTFPSPCCCRPFPVLCKVFFSSLSFFLVFCKKKFSFFPSRLLQFFVLFLSFSSFAIFCSLSFLLVCFSLHCLPFISSFAKKNSLSFLLVCLSLYCLPFILSFAKKNSLSFLLVSLFLYCLPFILSFAKKKFSFVPSSFSRSIGFRSSFCCRALSSAFHNFIFLSFLLVCLSPLPPLHLRFLFFYPCSTQKS
jgi:hypothetical protein